MRALVAAASLIKVLLHFLNDLVDAET